MSLLLVSGLAGAMGVDPTQPPAHRLPLAADAAGAAGTPSLQGILRGAQGSRALIGGAALGVGQEHGGARVLAIHAQSVLVEHQGQRLLLRLAESVMQPSR